MSSLLSLTAQLAAKLAKARTAREKYDLLISNEHNEKLVPTLSAEDLYFTIKDLGLSDSLELIRLVSPAQLRSFIDLDSWRRDHFDCAVALNWLRAASTDDDTDRFRKKIDHLDVELLELLLKNTVKVHDLSEDEDPEPEGVSFRSPEGRFLVEFMVEGAEYTGVRRLLDELYAQDPFRTARLLEAVRWETPSELEESAYRWRSARLADLGFPELAEALSYFAYTNPDQTLPQLGHVPAVPRGFFLARLPEGGLFFDRAVAEVAAEDRSIVERQLVTVLNAVMVVEAIDPGETDQARRAFGAARDTLSLGLEHATQNDASQAAMLLVSAPLKRVFQVGVSLALRLKFRVDRLVRAQRWPLKDRTDDQSDEHQQLAQLQAEVVKALRRKHPLYAQVLDSPNSTGSHRPFRDLADIGRVAAVLDQIERT